MAQLANIVINDGATTPLAHTLTPVQQTPPTWRDTVAALPLVGQISTVVTNKMDMGNGLNKVRVVLNVPVVETIGTNGANGYVAGPKVAFVVKANLDLILPSRSTVQDRKNLRILLINALANQQIIDSIDSLAMPF